jgi:hypothetical protein
MPHTGSCVIENPSLGTAPGSAVALGRGPCRKETPGMNYSSEGCFSAEIVGAAPDHLGVVRRGHPSLEDTAARQLGQRASASGKIPRALDGHSRVHGRHLGLECAVTGIAVRMHVMEVAGLFSLPLHAIGSADIGHSGVVPPGFRGLVLAQHNRDCKLSVRWSRHADSCLRLQFRRARSGKVRHVQPPRRFPFLASSIG